MEYSCGNTATFGSRITPHCRGQRDDFVIESIDLGPIIKMDIGHDDRSVLVESHPL